MKLRFNPRFLGIMIGLIMIFSFVYAVFNGIDQFWTHSRGTRVETVEAAIQKAAVQCYALEGSYPPNIEYLQKNYGVVIDNDRYYYYYNVFASNIMPEIGVYEKNGTEGVAVDVQ